jgi:hypothetical protein
LLDSADLYLTDPDQPQLWGAVDWRRFDRIRVLHRTRTPTGTAVIDLEALIVAIADSITPERWIRTISTTRALRYIAPSLWDVTAYRWDDPAGVWSY